MEDLSEILILVLIAIFGGIVKSKKNKKKAADKPAPAKQPDAPAKPDAPGFPAMKNLENAFAAFTELLEDEDLPDPDQPAAAPVKMREKTSIEAETAMKQRTQLIRNRIQESLSGQSPTDKHGCIGGSMPDHDAEGESLAEHAAHELKRAAKLQEEAAIRAENLRNPGLTELRKAVVMAEILDKPVSLRRRRI